MAEELEQLVEKQAGGRKLTSKPKNQAASQLSGK